MPTRPSAVPRPWSTRAPPVASAASPCCRSWPRRPCCSPPAARRPSAIDHHDQGRHGHHHGGGLAVEPRELADQRRWPCRRRARACCTRCSTCGRPQIQKEWPSVSITTASTGLGHRHLVGRRRARSTSAPPTPTCRPAQAQQYPDLENIPLAISAQQMNYNLPGVDRPPEADGPVLAGDLPGQHHQLERRQDRGAEPGRDAAQHDHRHRAPRRTAPVTPSCSLVPHRVRPERVDDRRPAPP